MSTKPTYRPDIDGLRAVAVLSVVLYHYGASWLPGGFTGVDIFFVISGYVITVKLSREIASGEFSILGFYDGRVRRILPAALVTILVSLIAGYFLLWPGDYVSLGASAAYSAAGMANLFFFWNTGYFDQESGLQPLLHFWSLGVEEQFYVLWPIVLWLAMWASKARLRVLLLVFSAATVAGLITAASAVEHDPKAAFYLPHFRAWELSIGALLALVPVISSRLLTYVLALAGALMVGISFLAIHETDPFPGLNAAYACIGSALLIWPKRTTPITSLLSVKPMIFVGKISYSLYLWHWPIWVFYRHYTNGAVPSFGEAMVLGALTFVVATLSWRYVEQPFRRPLGNQFRVVVAGLVSIAFVAFTANLVVANAGFINRTSAGTEPLSSLEAMWNWNCPATVDLPEIGSACSFGAPWETAEVRVLLWGDSHAEHMAPLLQVYAEDRNASVALYRACSPALDGKQFVPSFFEYPDYDIACEKARNAVVSLAAMGDIDKIVLASSWSSIADTIVGPDRVDTPRETGIQLLEEGVTSIAKTLSAEGVDVSIIATVPIWPSDPVPCAVNASSRLVRSPCVGLNQVITTDEFNGRQGDEYRALEAAASRAGARLIEPASAMCMPGGQCLAWLDGEFLYRDISHLRRNLRPTTLAKLADMIGIEALF